MPSVRLSVVDLNKNLKTERDGSIHGLSGLARTPLRAPYEGSFIVVSECFGELASQGSGNISGLSGLDRTPLRALCRVSFGAVS